MGQSTSLRKTLIGVVIFLSVALLATSIYLGVLFVKGKVTKNLDKIGAPPSEINEQDNTDSKVVVEVTEPISILLLGIDNRPETGSMNTDVIMVATLNPERKSATIVSIPRDTHIRPEDQGLPSRKANYYYPHFHLTDKDTAYYETKKLFGEYLDIKIDAAVTVDFEGFRRMVDELGGVDIDVPMDMRYIDTEDGTNINLRKGFQTLNGKEALDYVRYRKSNNGTAESNDQERNKRQHEVIDQMVGKIFTLGGVMKIGSLLDIAGDHVKTDIPANQLMDFIQKYIGIDRDKIEYISLEGEWISPFVEIDEDELEEARKALKAQLELEPPASGGIEPSSTPATDSAIESPTP